MIPTDYRHYDQLPRTGSNKLDRKACWPPTRRAAKP